MYPSLRSCHERSEDEVGSHERAEDGCHFAFEMECSRLVKEVAGDEIEGNEGVGDIEMIGDDVISREINLCMVIENGGHAQSPRYVNPLLSGHFWVGGVGVVSGVGLVGMPT